MCGGHCQDPLGASRCPPPSLVRLVFKGLILPPAPVPRSPSAQKAARRAPWCLLQGDAGKVSVFLVRRGCPPAAAAVPAPAPARRCAPTRHSCPQEGAGSCLQRENALTAWVAPNRAAQPGSVHRPSPAGHRAVPGRPAPASLCFHPLPAHLPDACHPGGPCGRVGTSMPAPVPHPETSPNPYGPCSQQIQSQLAPHPSHPCQAWHTINMKDFLALCRHPACSPAAGN